MKWWKLPLDPALRLVGPVLKDCGTRDEYVTGENALAVILGVSKRNVYRWVQDGVPWDTAEDIAWKLGVHPYDIWQDAFDWVSPLPEDEPFGRFCGRRLWERIAAHDCADDGCLCGRDAA